MLLSPVRLLAGLTAAISLLFASGCSRVLFMTANAPTAFGSFKRIADIPYGEGPRQRLDIYLPQDNASPPASNAGRPVVIFWYGGSWVRGDRGSYRFVGAALAERGYVAVVPDYRLYPDVRFPDFLTDGAAAVAWVQKHIERFGGDPHRIVLMGHSAGAHMAASLALNDKLLAHAGARQDWICGLVGLSGPYALEANTNFLRSIFSGPYTPNDWQPVRFVTRSAPPALLVHGMDDGVVSPSHTIKLRDALRAAGVRVDTELYPDRGHAATVAGFTSATPYRAPVLERTVQFIASATSQTGPLR